MTNDDPAQLSDDELRDAVAKIKPSPLTDAFLIGFLIGIIIFSLFANTWGLVTLVPLFLIYLFVKKPKQHAALKAELAKRNLR